jgi:protein-L-isoaspartate(D-aspartate) O-methyltransferase
MRRRIDAAGERRSEKSLRQDGRLRKSRAGTCCHRARDQFEHLESSWPHPLRFGGKLTSRQETIEQHCAPTARWAGHLSRLVAMLAFVGILDDAVLAQDPWAEPRAVMVRTIQDHAALLPEAASADGLSAKVLDVMGKVPRHEFVPERVKRQAYADAPLPIGYGQTISQPFIVALMTHLIGASPDSTVLEIGTGSGYQAAVLSPLVKTVCTIEIIPGLGETAARHLKDLGYDNVQTKIGDGYFGWPECGPFDGILVTAAAGHVPLPLVKQLKPGGRMVIPVGSVFGPQFLTLVEKTGGGQITTRQLLPVQFVPLARDSQ